MKVYCAGILVILSLCLVIIISCGKKPEVKPTSLSVVFFGDSVTFGYGIEDKAESFYTRISNIMKTGMYGNVSTVNAGVSGDDTFQALKRISSDVLIHEPDIVIIAFGLNDCQNKSITVQKFSENINAIINAIPSAEIILATSNTFMDSGQSLWKELNDSLELYMMEIREIARVKKLTLIDVYAAWENHLRQDSRHMESMYIDATHPSAKGHSLIYETYMNVLRKKLTN